MIRILIADDTTSILDGLCSTLEAQPDIQVVGAAKNGIEAVEKTAALLPDVVIMDVRMPRMDGIEATRIVREAGTPVGILVLGVFSDYMEAAFDAGADSFLAKDCEPQELCSEIRSISARLRAETQERETLGTNEVAAEHGRNGIVFESQERTSQL